MNRIRATAGLLMILALLGGCATPQPISMLFAPSYSPAYNFAASGKSPTAVPYTIGIIDMAVHFEAIPPNFLAEQLTPATRQAQHDFAQAFSHGLEKIILAKGMTVDGPYESYADMTYPERSRCGYLIQPEITFKVTLGEGNGLITPFPDTYTNVYDARPVPVARRSVALKVTTDLDYLILDPLTNQKLERHSLKLDEFDLNYDLLAVHEGKDWRMLRKDYPQYLNQAYAFARLFDQAYAKFMPKIEGLVSPEEFKSLEKFKQEIREKKVY